MSSIDPPRQRLILAILVVSAVLIWIDSTVLGIALERLADPVDGLGATPGQLQWAIGVYSLLLATAVFLAGALGDRYGHRTVPMLGLLGVSYGLIEGGHQGKWNRWQVWAGIGAGPLLLAGFLYSECREREPTSDPRLFRNRRFAAGNFALAAVFLTLTGQSFYLAFYLQGARGMSALSAGLMSMPTAAGPRTRSRRSSRRRCRSAGRRTPAVRRSGTFRSC